MTDQQPRRAQVSVAIVGAGYIADFHLAALRALPGVEVRAICDLNGALAARYARAHGIPRSYSQLDEMLRQEQLDVVHVLTPPHVHARNGQQVLAAGVDALIEKPLCHSAEDCQTLTQQATDAGRALGVSHNFLFYPIYERLVSDVQEGRLGQIDQVDIVWNKELGQLRGGPFNAWMLQTPTNILFEVAPHSLAHVIHLVGPPDTLSVAVRDPLELPGGKTFYRRWEIMCWQANTSVRVRFSFIDGYSEHYIHVRGSTASVHVDFENNTYVRSEHTPYMLDIDRFATTWSAARNGAWQATTTLTQFVLGKLRLSKVKPPFAESIARTVRTFYAGRGGELDARVAPAMGDAVVALAEWVAQESGLVDATPETRIAAVESSADLAPPPPANVLVLGGTGFIGRALVRQLRSAGYGVRLVARNPASCPSELTSLQVEVCRGDLTDTASLEAALDGIEYVYHLARGGGKTWNDYLTTDVEPTRRLAELCAQRPLKRFCYASSIALYAAGRSAGTITEQTPPHSGILRTAPYAKSKAENERLLLDLHRKQGLPVVIFRPGVVIGRGTSPYHWGIAAWPYTSVCNLWGDGNNQLPLVLVDDVADAMVRVLTIPQIEGQSYNLASPPCVTANEYLNEVEQRAGVRIRRCRVPAWRAYVIALGKWMLKTVGRDPEAAFPSYADWDGRSLAARFDCSKAERELGWTPTTDRHTMITAGIHPLVDDFCR